VTAVTHHAFDSMLSAFATPEVNAGGSGRPLALSWRLVRGRRPPERAVSDAHKVGGDDEAITDGVDGADAAAAELAGPDTELLHGCCPKSGSGLQAAHLSALSSVTDAAIAGWPRRGIAAVSEVGGGPRDPA
jgi:hypothetical protein